jgi:hypothetical protein
MECRVKGMALVVEHQKIKHNNCPFPNKQKQKSEWKYLSLLCFVLCPEIDP